ncbi:MAG: NUDIX domain-containing protein [Actinobacteria bacterium]|nr:NUDIX domain-containing protein [Actinomycetota bacterium]
MPEPRIRPAARALVVTPDHHVLLVRFEFPAGTRWALPGGGLEHGEDHRSALARELREEVGLNDIEIGPHIWTREIRIALLDGLWDGQREHVHLVEVPRMFDPAPTMTWDELAAEYLFEIRWWHRDEIAGSDVTFAPAALADHLGSLLDHGIPREPVDVGV